MGSFQQVDWPHYAVLDSANKCAWCSFEMSWHKYSLPWQAPFLERPIYETSGYYGGHTLTEFRTELTPVVIDHLERKANAVERAKELAGDTIEDIMSEHHEQREDGVWIPKKEDAVSPTHYAKLTPQPIQVAHAWNLHHDLATALKYIARYNETQNLRDIEKAKRFLEFFINNVERGDPLADAT